MIFKRKYAAALAAALMVTTAGITAQAFHADTGIVVPVYGLDDSGVHLYDAHIVANDIQTVMNGEDMNLGTLNVNKLTIHGQEIASSDDITNIKEDITQNAAWDAQQQTQIDQKVADRIAADNALSGRIDGLDNRIDDLSGEVDEVGAISAALAGLHPLDYDGTGSKFQLSAAMGTYDGTQAMAMGGFYHFNEDVMLSLGGATTFSGEHKTAANLGVTFRVGQGGRKEKQASADVAAQIEAMQAQMQAMQEKIAALEAEKAAPAPEAAPAEETEVPAPSASYMDSLSRAAKYLYFKTKKAPKGAFFHLFSARPIPRIRPAPVRQVQTNEKSRCCNTCFFLIFWGTTLNYLYYVMRI